MTMLNYHTFEFHGQKIPAYMVSGMQDYFKYGYEPGSFLYAVLCNDLVGAVSAADDVNITRIPVYAAFLYNEAPSPSWGSKEKVEAWMERQREAVLKEVEAASCSEEGMAHD